MYYEEFEKKIVSYFIIFKTLFYFSLKFAPLNLSLSSLIKKSSY